MSFSHQYENGTKSMCEILLISELSDNIQSTIENKNNVIIYVEKNSDFFDYAPIFLGKKKYNFGHDELDILDALDNILDNDKEIDGKQYNADVRLINQITKYLAEKGKHLFNYSGVLKKEYFSLSKKEVVEKYFCEIDLNDYEAVIEKYDIDEHIYKMIKDASYYDTILVDEYEYKSFFTDKIIKKIKFDLFVM